MDLKQEKQAVRDSIPKIMKIESLPNKYQAVDKALFKFADFAFENDPTEGELVTVDINERVNRFGVESHEFYIEFGGFGVRKTTYYKINESLGTKNLIGVDFCIDKDIEADQLNGLELALKVSTAKNGKYALSNNDLKHGYYFNFRGLKVPLKALFNMNNKTHGIVGICFESARECPSRKLGLCQLPSDKLCYARSGESRATRKNNESGERGMDSFFNAVLSGIYWDLFAESSEVRRTLFKYLEAKNIETIRFNLKGDFRDSTDLAVIYHLANNGFNLTGYTARDDLKEELGTLASHPNIILNGSNLKYTNRFKATSSLREFAEAKYKCLGECQKCRKCYSLRDKEIVCLIHGSGSETTLNNWDNCSFLGDLFECRGVEIENGKAKGLVTNLNALLGTNFKSTKEALRFAGVDC